jgi:hypothetical protein
LQYLGAIEGSQSGSATYTGSTTDLDPASYTLGTSPTAGDPNHDCDRRFVVPEFSKSVVDRQLNFIARLIPRGPGDQCLGPVMATFTSVNLSGEEITDFLPRRIR